MECCDGICGAFGPRKGSHNPKQSKMAAPIHLRFTMTLWTVTQALDE